MSRLRGLAPYGQYAIQRELRLESGFLQPLGHFVQPLLGSGFLLGGFLVLRLLRRLLGDFLLVQLVQLRRPSLRLIGQLAMTGTMAFMLVPLI